MGIGTPSIHNKIPRPIKFSHRQHGRFVVVEQHPSAITNARRRQKVPAPRDFMGAKHGYAKGCVRPVAGLLRMLNEKGVALFLGPCTAPCSARLEPRTQGSAKRS